MGKKVLILTGGGSKGAFQAGVIEQLYKSGWRADAVMGVSVGSLNGIMVATGQWTQLVPLWRTISPDKVLKKRGAVKTAWNFVKHKAGVDKPYMGFYSNEPLMRTVKNNIGSRMTADFYCGSVNLWTGEYVDSSAMTGNVPWAVIDSVVASTAIPVVFDPVVVHSFGRLAALHVDGGVRHNSPIGTALRYYPDVEEVVIVSCKDYDEDWKANMPAHDLIDVARNSLSFAMNEIATKDIREFRRINTLVRQAEEKGVTLTKRNGQSYKYINARIYQPGGPLGDALNFTAKQARKNIEIGLNAVNITL